MFASPLSNMKFYIKMCILTLGFFSGKGEILLKLMNCDGAIP